HRPGVGVPDVVTGTVIVQLVAGLVMVRPVTTIWLEPAAAVTVPVLVHVPPTAPPVATSPAGSVSVNENTCVGLFAGTVSVKVSVVVAPTPIEAGLNALVSTGTE